MSKRLDRVGLPALCVLPAPALTAAQNETLIDKPELLTKDPFGAGWMLIVRPNGDDWRSRLVTGDNLAVAIEDWIVRGWYKDRRS